MSRFLVPAFIALAGAAAAAPDISGNVRVVDGDTFDVGSVRVRLHGVDTPEPGQTCDWQRVRDWPCGDWVSDRVRQRVEGHTARCTFVETDAYGRSVARCRVDGVDLGRWLVQEGLAVAYVKYSADYVADQAAAEDALRGLHGFAFAEPADYRAAHRAGYVTRASSPAPEGCAIKGNVSHHGGTRIYHVPGQQWYDRTVISADRGERWFCSEAEARAAGWRRALR